MEHILLIKTANLIFTKFFLFLVNKMFVLGFFRAEVTSDSVTVTETTEQPGTLKS